MLIGMSDNKGHKHCSCEGLFLVGMLEGPSGEGLWVREPSSPQLGSSDCLYGG